MLTHSEFPVFRYFKNGNAYSGQHKGMRYMLTPQTRPDPDDANGKRKLCYLVAQVWPGPWSLDCTDPTRVLTSEFFCAEEHEEEGKTQAIDWLAEQFAAHAQEWAETPSLLDCDPWQPAPESAPTDEKNQ